jgi:hypothetical protein
VRVKTIASCFAAMALVLGVAALVTATPADARPPIRCTIEVGDAGCPPCYQWNGHLCRCVKVAACRG